MTTETIDITPSWRGILPALIAMLQSEEPAVRAVRSDAMFELSRMADAADLAREAVPDLVNSLRSLIDYFGADVDNGIDELLTNARAVVSDLEERLNKHTQIKGRG